MKNPAINPTIAVMIVGSVGNFESNIATSNITMQTPIQKAKVIAMKNRPLRPAIMLSSGFGGPLRSVVTVEVVAIVSVGFGVIVVSSVMLRRFLNYNPDNLLKIVRCGLAQTSNFGALAFVGVDDRAFREVRLGIEESFDRDFRGDRSDLICFFIGTVCLRCGVARAPSEDEHVY